MNSTNSDLVLPSGRMRPTNASLGLVLAALLGGASCSGGAKSMAPPAQAVAVCASYSVVAPLTQVAPLLGDLSGLWTVQGGAVTTCLGGDDQPLDVDLGGAWVVVQDGRSLFIDMIDTAFVGTWTGTIEDDGQFAIALDELTITGRIVSYASTPGALYVDEAMGDFTSLFPDAECPMPIPYVVDLSAVRGPLEPSSGDLTGVWEFRFAEIATQGCQPDVPALLTVMVVQDPLGLLDIVELDVEGGLRLRGVYDTDEGHGALGPDSESVECGMLAAFQVTADGQILGRGAIGEIDSESELTCGTLFTLSGERVGR